MEKPTHLRRPERAGSPHVHDSAYRRERKANNMEVMIPIERQPAPKPCRGPPVVSKGSRLSDVKVNAPQEE